MILPKIIIPSSLQSQVIKISEPHYDKTPLSGISIGLILLAINENIIDEAAFIEAHNSKSKLTKLASYCAKSLTSYVRTLFKSDNYNCMTLSFQTFNNNDSIIGDDDALIGFRLTIDSFLIYNLALNKDIPKPLHLLAQKISLLMADSLDCINSFDCNENSYESEQWEILKDSAKDLKVEADFALYTKLFINDVIFEDEDEFSAFKESMSWYDQATKESGIMHDDATSIDVHLQTLSAVDKAHPAYAKLIAVFSLLKGTIRAKIKFEQSNQHGYEEETSPFHFGLLTFSGFFDEGVNLRQHMRDINDVGEEMVSVFTPLSLNALGNTVKYLDKLCSLAKLCDESLSDFVTPLSL